MRIFLITIFVGELNEVENRHTETNSDANTVKDKPNEPDERINGENPNKPSRPDCDKRQKD